MAKQILVTGANGHLGNNVVRALLDQGDANVRASVRNPQKKEPFVGLDCEVVAADLMDKDSLRRALQGMDTLYQVAAVFKHWARNPQRDIINPTVQGTRNIMKAATEAGVQRVIYVSSSVTLDPHLMETQGYLDESGWRTNFHNNPYYQAKVESEQVAWKLARQLDIEMVSVLPAAMIGPNAYNLTATMNYMQTVLRQDVPIDVNFYFNWVDVRDVADGMIAADKKGKNGERYILSGDESGYGTRELIEIAREVKPDIRMPRLIPQSVLYTMAAFSEFGAQVTGRDPLILRSQVELYYGNNERIRSAKAKQELGYTPRPSREAIREAFIYLQQREGQLA